MSIMMVMYFLERKDIVQFPGWMWGFMITGFTLQILISFINREQ